MGKPIINLLLFQNDSATPWRLFPARFAGMALSYSSGGWRVCHFTQVGAVLDDGIC